MGTYLLQLLVIPIFFIINFCTLLVVKHRHSLVQHEIHRLELLELQAVVDRLAFYSKEVNSIPVPVLDYSLYYYLGVGIVIGVIGAAIIYNPYYWCAKKVSFTLVKASIGIIHTYTPPEVSGVLNKPITWIFHRVILESGTSSVQVMEKMSGFGKALLLSDPQIAFYEQTIPSFFIVMETLRSLL